MFSMFGRTGPPQKGAPHEDQHELMQHPTYRKTIEVIKRKQFCVATCPVISSRQVTALLTSYTLHNTSLSVIRAIKIHILLCRFQRRRLLSMTLFCPSGPFSHHPFSPSSPPSSLSPPSFLSLPLLSPLALSIRSPPVFSVPALLLPLSTTIP